MEWLRKTPIVSLLFAAAMAAVPFLLAQNPVAGTMHFEQAREEARGYLDRNPDLAVDALGERIIGAEWLREMREANASADEPAIALPPRLLARTQARLDALIEEGYAARLSADPVWRLGVLDEDTPARNYIAHAFVHEAWIGALLCIAVLLIAGAPLERAWGSPVLAFFSVAAIPATGLAYRFLDGSSGVPWSGGAGLAGAMLGAYCIRGLGGYFTLPGIVLLAAWLGVETFGVRHFRFEDFGSIPWATFCGSVGFGAAVSSVLRLLNVESRIVDREDQGAPHPALVRAARLQADGEPYPAFDLLQATWRGEQKNEEVAEAFFASAVEIGQAGAAANAVLPMLRRAVKQGDMSAALDYWRPLVACEAEVALDPTSALRLGEALLDAGHPDEVMFSLRTALAASPSGAHAIRIVNLARDLDEDLARDAATVALQDPTLDPALRDQLEAMLVVPNVEVPNAEAQSTEETTAAPLSALDRRTHAEHHSTEITSFPQGPAIEEEGPNRTGLDLDFSGELGSPGADESMDLDLDLDPNALSEDLLNGGAVGGGDVLSHWNGQSESDGAEAQPDDLEVGPDDGALLLETDEELERASALGRKARERDWLDSAYDEDDLDETPLIDETGEQTTPMLEVPEEPGERTGVFDQETQFMTQAPVFTEERRGAPTAERGVVRETAMPLDSIRQVAVASPDHPSEIVFGEVPEASETEAVEIPQAPLRVLKALDAVPVSADEDSIEIDVDGRGKSRLPYGRIKAIAVGAVTGIDARSVLIIDFVLNWASDPSEPMKSIRFRSNRFDPLTFVPGAGDPLEALTKWISDLERDSCARCLPSRQLLEGVFAPFSSLEEYERVVLSATSSDSPEAR